MVGNLVRTSILDMNENKKFIEKSPEERQIILDKLSKVLDSLKEVSDLSNPGLFEQIIETYENSRNHKK